MFDIGRQGPWVVVRPSGELDLAVADKFRSTVFQAVRRDRTPCVAIDFSAVTFLDSSGLSVIAATLKEIHQLAGHLVLVGLSGRIRLVLEITGMTTILDIRDSLDTEEEFAVDWILEPPDLTGTV